MKIPNENKNFKSALILWKKKCNACNSCIRSRAATAKIPADSKHFEIGEDEEYDDNLDLTFNSAREGFELESPPRPKADTSKKTEPHEGKHQDSLLDANVSGAGGFERHLFSASSGAASTPTGVAQGNSYGAPGLQLPDQMNRSKNGIVPDVNSVPPMPSLVPPSSSQFSGPLGPAGENIVTSAPVYKHKTHEAETVVIKPIPHIRDLRYWKLISPIRLCLKGF